MTGLAISFTAIVLALLLGYAVHRAMHRPKHSASDIEALKFYYAAQRRAHKKSKDIGRRLVRERTEQIKREIA